MRTVRRLLVPAVANHLSAILSKLNARNRTDAVVTANKITLFR